MDLDDAYANAAHIAGAEHYPPLWEAQAAAFRDALGPRARLDQRYGSAEREWFDLFLPEAPPRGVIVFIHGGYWMRFGPRDWSHLAQGALDHGWACAMPAYTLAPTARIAQITAQIGRAVAAVATLVDGAITVTGHSAGGHLSARMACANAPLPGRLAARIGNVVPISPLGDLRPLRHTAMNHTLGLDPAEAEAESPALLRPRRDCTVTIWVGGDERPVFRDQARDLATAWNAGLHIAPRLHHFNVIDDLARPDSALVARLTAA